MQEPSILLITIFLSGICIRRHVRAASYMRLINDPCGPSEVTMNAFRVPKSGRHHGNISGLHVAHRYSFDHTANPLHLIFTTSGRTIFNSNFEGFWS